MPAMASRAPPERHPAAAPSPFPLSCILTSILCDVGDAYLLHGVGASKGSHRAHLRPIGPPGTGREAADPSLHMSHLKVSNRPGLANAAGDYKRRNAGRGADARCPLQRVCHLGPAPAVVARVEGGRGALGGIPVAAHAALPGACRQQRSGGWAGAACRVGNPRVGRVPPQLLRSLSVVLMCQPACTVGHLPM